MLQKGELVIVPRADYEAMSHTHKRLLWEEEDTDEAICVFEKERAERKLRKATSFSDILGHTASSGKRK